MKHGIHMRALAVGIATTVLLAGCGRGGDDSEASTGVTTKPCPEAVNKDNGCIYLGTLSDLTKGPYAALAAPNSAAQKAFWDQVNENGGVGGYDVDVTKFVGDTEYNPELHSRKYQEMRADILALAISTGSSTTLAILEDIKSDNVIAAPMSWNSAWDWEPNVLGSGANYCFQSMNGIDWAVDQGIKGSVLAISYPNDMGKDSAFGAREAAKKHGLKYSGIETPPGQDNQAGAIAAIVKAQPDLVYLSTGPTELATIVGGAVQQGYKGRFLGAGPTWNVGLLKTPVAELLKTRYNQVAPFAPFGTDTPGHQAMRKAMAGSPPNEAFAWGWIWSYPILTALEKAAKSSDGLSRETVLDAAKNLGVVDYQGMLPAGEKLELGDGVSKLIWRESVVNRVDPQAPTGVTVESDFAVGDTAKSFEYTKPCLALG